MKNYDENDILKSINKCFPEVTRIEITQDKYVKCFKDSLFEDEDGFYTNDLNYWIKKQMEESK